MEGPMYTKKSDSSHFAKKYEVKFEKVKYKRIFTVSKIKNSWNSN